MTLPKSLTTVTPFSKFLAMLFFILLPFMGFCFGMAYQQKLNNIVPQATTSAQYSNPSPTPTPNIPSLTPTPTTKDLSCSDISKNPNDYFNLGDYHKPTAKINLTPPSGPYGKVLVSGSNWPANTKIHIDVVAIGGTEWPTGPLVITDSQGKFSNFEVTIGSKDSNACAYLVLGVLDNYYPYSNPIENPIHAEALYTKK